MSHFTTLEKHCPTSLHQPTILFKRNCHHPLQIKVTTCKSANMMDKTTPLSLRDSNIPLAIIQKLKE